MAEGGRVPFDLGARNRAWNDRGDDRMAKGKMQRRRGKRNTMAGADSLDFLHPLQDLGAGGRIIVHRAGNGSGRQNPGIVDAANDDPEDPLLAARELAFEHVLPKQRVAHGEQEEIHVEKIEKTRDRAQRIEARANAANDACFSQFRERLPSARLELREIGVERRGIVVPGIEVVNEKDIAPVYPEPLEAVLERAHHAVVAVVEYGLKLEAAEPLILDGVGAERPPQDAADFRRNDIGIARLAKKRAAERMFGQSAPVPWRRIEITHAAVPCGADDPRRLVIVDLVKKFAQRRGAEAELGHADVRPAKLTRLQRRESCAAHV